MQMIRRYNEATETRKERPEQEDQPDLENAHWQTSQTRKSTTERNLQEHTVHQTDCEVRSSKSYGQNKALKRR